MNTDGTAWNDDDMESAYWYGWRAWAIDSAEGTYAN